MMSPTRLHMLSGFYRNDQPGGIGLMYQGAADVAQRIETAMSELQTLPNDPAYIVDEFISRLEEFGAAAMPLSGKDGLEAIIAIRYLELAGALTGDEFNGLSYVYEAPPTSQQQLSERHAPSSVSCMWPESAGLDDGQHRSRPMPRARKG